MELISLFPANKLSCSYQHRLNNVQRISQQAVRAAINQLYTWNCGDRASLPPHLQLGHACVLAYLIFALGANLQALILEVR